MIDALQPNLFVELGTHNGLSYFSFCQAIKQKKLLTKCFAIDTWKGDEHAGFYDDSIFEFVHKINERYPFSTLKRSTFDDALSFFENKSIDLLHIDGLHTYEAVKHDFNNWLPKISDSGIVVFHDTNVMERGFGVYKLWEELINEYPFFEFKHGHGLGILGVGKNLPSAISNLFKNGLMPETQFAIRKVYHRLGSLTGAEQEIKNLQTKKYLQPLHNITAQVYCKKKGEEFNESDSLTQTAELTNMQSSLVFKVDEDFSSLIKLRIDPAREQGIIYLHSISLSNDEGQIFLNWDEIKNSCVSSNTILVKSTLIENTFILIAITNDPNIEIDLQSFNNVLHSKNFNAAITLSSPDDELVQKELFNFSAKQLNKQSDNNLYEIFIENLQSAKKEINDVIQNNTKEILLQLNKENLITLNKVEEEKNNLQTVLNEQKLSANKNINELNDKLREKEILINDLSKEIVSTKETEIILQQQLLQHKMQLQSLQTVFEQSQKDYSDLETKNKEEIFTVKKELNEKIAFSKNQKDAIEQQKQQLFLKEEDIKNLEEKITVLKNKYENNSLFEIIKNRIIKVDKK